MLINCKGSGRHGCNGKITVSCLGNWREDGMLQLLGEAIHYPAASRPQQSQNCSLGSHMRLRCQGIYSLLEIQRRH